MSDEAGKAEDGAAREAESPPGAVVEGPAVLRGRAEEAGEAGEEATEDLPTLPPVSRGSVAGLRWATFPPKRPSGQGGPHQIGRDRVSPDQIGPASYETGPPTAILPTVQGGPQVRPGRGPSAADDTVEVAPVGGLDWAGRPDWAEGQGWTEGQGWSEGQDWAGGGDDAASEDRSDGQPARRRRRGRIVVLLAVLVFVAAIGVGALVLAGSSPRRSGARAPTPQASFEGFLAESAQAHQLVSVAVGDACKPVSPATAPRQALILQVHRAVELRRAVLSGTVSDKQLLLQMNGGASLVRDLDDATGASLSADQGYEAWLQDLQATGCYGAPTNDIHYRAANEASVAASVAKERVVAIWAGVASRYGLRSWAAGQL